MPLSQDSVLAKKMSALGIRKKDLVESFIHSSSPGGQNVNKAATCVYLRHLPTGLEVKCQIERTQGQNRYLARKILADKIRARFEHKTLAARMSMEKLRRQKRKKPFSVKMRILEEKRRRANKKTARKKINEIEVA